MKKKEKQSLRSMSEVELVKHIGTLEAEITKAKLDRKVRAKRKEIAVAKTILRERELSSKL